MYHSSEDVPQLSL